MHEHYTCKKRKNMRSAENVIEQQIFAILRILR